MKKRIKYILLSTILVLILIGGYGLHIVSSGFNIDKPVYIYVDNSRNYDSLLVQIENKAQIKNFSGFKLASSLLDYKDNMKPGRYAVTPDMTTLDLVRALRNGNQSPVQLKFNNIRTKKDFAEHISEQLLFSYDELFSALEDTETCKKLGFAPTTVAAMFIPNTYEFYWTISVEDFLGRMHKEYKKFWSDKRQAEAKALGLSPIEVSSLAAIVEEECTYSDEYPMVAGLYLNRLRIGQPLQADPTVKFAVGDFSLRRILNVHLKVESPYNTYLHSGLPPGPIRIPSIKGIDSVLNASKHDFFYMCAKADFSGRHDFAKTYAEHQRNAALYRSSLNKRGIF